MPDGQEQFQYVRMPDGSYGKFRADATDTDISKAIARDFPEAYAKEHTAAAPNAINKEIQRRENIKAMAPNEVTGVPESPEDAAKDVSTTGAALSVPAMIASPAAAIRGLVGTGIGAAAGGFGGREVGRLFGPTGEKVGQDIGASIGALGGGYFSATPDPLTGKTSLSPSDWLTRFRSPEEIEAAEAKGAQRVAAARNEMYEDLAKRRMARGREVARIEAGGAPGTGAQRPGEGRLILSPEEANTEATQRAQIEREAKERGMMHAGGQKPGKAPRFVLPSQTIASPQEGISPEEFRQIREGARIAPVTAPRLGEGTSAVNLVSGEAPRTNTPQILQSQGFDRGRLQGIIQNPFATAEERAVAQRSLDAGFPPADQEQ